MPFFISKNRAARIFITISVWGLFISEIILLVFPIDWFPRFYDVRFFGWASLLGAAAILFLPKLIVVKEGSADAGRKNNAAGLFQIFIAIMLLNNAAGDLGLYQLYKIGFEFDKLIHFGNSLLCAAAVPVILNKRFGIRFARAIIISFFAVLMGGAIWEIYEYGVDLIWETHIAGIYGLDVKDDTTRDLLFNSAGAIIGALSISAIKLRK
jgi:hypothetical protein